MSRQVSRAIIEVLVRDVLRRKGAIDDDAAREVEMVFDSDSPWHLKHEIVAVGRKLWERQDVDGNGGNISCRLTDDWVLCTPTLMSKGDLRAEDICMVDFDGRQLAGVRRRSSEILLHLAIMKAVPAARAVVHAHPPHATVYALAHHVPPVAMLAEHEVFIGPVALVPYETPGTQACADAVVPLAARHNTILMANHGVVTWADNLIHAEWFLEVMDTTCRVLMLAGQAGLKPQEIPPATVGRPARDQEEARPAGCPLRRRSARGRHGHAGGGPGARGDRRRDGDPRPRGGVERARTARTQRYPWTAAGCRTSPTRAKTRRCWRRLPARPAAR